MKTAMKQAMVMSALTLTANSWGYPIYPYQAFLSQLKINSGIALKSHAAAQDAHEVDAIADIHSAAFAGNYSGAGNYAGAAVVAASANTDFAPAFAVDANHGWRAGGGWFLRAAGYFPERAASVADSGVWLQTPHDDADRKSFDDLLKELQPAGRENAGHRIAWGFPDIFHRPGDKSGAGSDAEKHKPDGAGAGPVNQVAVSEPGSIALICSGALGLLLTRRFSRKKAVNAWRASADRSRQHD